jgi:hypothetical protein
MELTFTQEERNAPPDLGQSRYIYFLEETAMKTIVTACRRTLTLILALGSSLPATMGVAQEGPNLRTMPCAAAQTLVKSNGSAILNSGPNIFNRYVKDAAFCAEDMYLQPAWVRTQDSKACFVGYTCVDLQN